ncbi:hypothetical protein [Actinocorallia longicatena]
MIYLIVGGGVMCAAALGLGRAVLGPWPFKSSDQPEQHDHWGQL